MASKILESIYKTVDDFNLQKYMKNYHISTLKCNINLGNACIFKKFYPCLSELGLSHQQIIPIHNLQH